MKKNNNITADTIYLLGRTAKTEQEDTIGFLFSLLPGKKVNLGKSNHNRSSLDTLFDLLEKKKIDQVVDALTTIGGQQVLANAKKRLIALKKTSSSLSGPEAECCIRLLSSLGTREDRLHALDLAAGGDTSLKKAFIIALAEKADKEIFSRIVRLAKTDAELKFVGALVLVGNNGDRNLIEQLVPENDHLAKAYLDVLMGQKEGISVISREIHSGDINNVLRATTLAAQLAKDEMLPDLQYAAGYFNHRYEPHDMKVRKTAWNGLAKIYARNLVLGMMEK